MKRNMAGVRSKAAGGNSHSLGGSGVTSLCSLALEHTMYLFLAVIVASLPAPQIGVGVVPLLDFYPHRTRL